MLIDNFRYYYPCSTIDDSSFEREFFDKVPDIDDKGYQDIEVNGEEKSIDEIRTYYEEYLQNVKAVEDKDILNYIEEKLLPEARLFGTNRSSFIQKLSSMLELKELVELLNMGAFDLTYTSLDGKALLDNYLDELKELKTVLAFYKEIPSQWMDSSRYKFREGVIEMLRYENAVIAMADSKATQERIKSTAHKKSYKEEEFILDVESKRTFITLIKQY